MSVIRAFIAINISAEIEQRLKTISQDLQQSLHGMPVRWVPVENIHLTLKFLGDVSISNLDLLKKVLDSESLGHLPFEFSVGDLGAFPSVRRPRVIWVDVKAPPDLLALQRGIDNETARLGYAREERPFSPHLTLGRISRNASSDEVRQISEVLSNVKVGYVGTAKVSAVFLYRSDLHPSGAIYSAIHSASLGSRQDPGKPGLSGHI
jgi:RNA 2',3'-cyclic 3'-phosphodiesterase